MRRWHGVSCYHSEQKIAKQEIIKQEEKCNSQYFWQLHFFAETNVNFLFGRISQRDLVFQTKLCLGIIFCDKRIIPNSQFSIGLIFWMASFGRRNFPRAFLSEDYSFSPYAKFSGKPIFLTPWCVHVRVRIIRLKCQFIEKFCVRTELIIPLDKFCSMFREKSLRQSF